MLVVVVGSSCLCLPITEIRNTQSVSQWPAFMWVQVAEVRSSLLCGEPLCQWGIFLAPNVSPQGAAVASISEVLLCPQDHERIHETLDSESSINSEFYFRKGVFFPQVELESTVILVF